ncbi:MAG TPA: PTS sugar transporter subunit IIA, partial [Rectinemataceae bacterium]
LCDRHPGFASAASSIARLANRLRARIRILALEGQGKNLARAFSAASGDSAPAFAEIPAWKNLLESSRSLQVPARFFVVFSARPQEASWHPALERIPHRLGEEYPDANILLVYLAREHSSSDQEAEIKASVDLLETAMAKGTVRVAMEQAAIADGIFELVASAFPFDRKTVTKTAARLTEIVQRQPLEIEPGVVLIHDRMPGISSPILCLGSRKQGFRLSLLERSVQVLVIILVPETQGAEDHLAFLSETARLFKEKNLARRMVEAKRPDDLGETG